MLANSDQARETGSVAAAVKALNPNAAVQTLETVSPSGGIMPIATHDARQDTAVASCADSIVLVHERPPFHMISKQSKIMHAKGAEATLTTAAARGGGASNLLLDQHRVHRAARCPQRGCRHVCGSAHRPATDIFSSTRLSYVSPDAARVARPATPSADEGAGLAYMTSTLQKLSPNELFRVSLEAAVFSSVPSRRSFEKTG